MHYRGVCPLRWEVGVQTGSFLNSHQYTDMNLWCWIHDVLLLEKMIEAPRGVVHSGVKERLCSDQPQTTGLILPVEDTVVPLHSYTRGTTYLVPLVQTPLCSPSQDRISLLNRPSHQREQSCSLWWEVKIAACLAVQRTATQFVEQMNSFVFKRWIRTRTCLVAKRHAVSSDATRHVSYHPMLRFPPISMCFVLSKAFHNWNGRDKQGKVEEGWR